MKWWKTVYMVIKVSVFELASSNGILETKQAMHRT
jgi:hypothetical protein